MYGLTTKKPGQIFHSNYRLERGNAIAQGSNKVLQEKTYSHLNSEVWSDQEENYIEFLRALKYDSNSHT